MGSFSVGKRREKAGFDVFKACIDRWNFFISFIPLISFRSRITWSSSRI